MSKYKLPLSADNRMTFLKTHTHTPSVISLSSPQKPSFYPTPLCARKIMYESDDSSVLYSIFCSSKLLQTCYTIKQRNGSTTFDLLQRPPGTLKVSPCCLQAPQSTCTSRHARAHTHTHTLEFQAQSFIVVHRGLVWL